MQDQNRLLLVEDDSINSNNSLIGDPYDDFEPKFIVLEEKEESSKIKTLQCIQVSYFKRIVVVPLLSICTALIFLLFLKHYVSFKTMFLYSKCTLRHATHLMVKGSDNTIKIVELKNRNPELVQTGSLDMSNYTERCPLLTFTYRYIKFQFDPFKRQFSPMVFNTNLNFNQFKDQFGRGLECEEDHSIKYIKYGPNLINVPLRGVMEIFISEVLNPFYIF